MNKNLIIPLIIIGLIIIGGGVYFMNRKPASITPQSANTNQMAGSQTNSNNAMMQKTSLKNLMMSSGNQKCTYEDSKTGSAGTTYIANGKMRGDFSTQYKGETTTSHMISDSQYAYIWMDNTESGYKVSLASMEDIKNEAQANIASQQSFDMNQELEYNCSNWNPDQNMFTVPSDKKFEDMSAMMEKAGKMMKDIPPVSPGNSAPGNSGACAACDQAPPEAQAQCKAALQCK